MKRRFLLVFALAVLAGAGAFAQPSGPTGNQPRAESSGLTKFDLDFPGGTPGALVAAIQKATGRPLNAIIPTEKADRLLPALKMSGVDVAQLFATLMEATNRTVLEYNTVSDTRMGFRTQGQPTDDSIWFFRVDERPSPPKMSQFFLLKPYLQQGLTVDDITTAIQTAWKMQGNEDGPTISYHKETELLIAVGDPIGLQTIQQALTALQPPAAGGTTADASDEKR